MQLGNNLIISEGAWVEVQNLLSQEISGFAFNSSKIYTLTNVGNSNIRLVNIET